MILLTIMKPKKQRQAAAEIRQPQRIPVRPTWWLFHGMSEFDRQTTLILYLERPLTARLLRSPRLRRMSAHHVRRGKAVTAAIGRKTRIRQCDA